VAAVLGQGGGPPETHGGLRPRPDRSVERALAARERTAGWLRQNEFPGLVLTRPGPVSWLTGGLPPPVDRSAGTDLVWAVVSGESATLVTTVVEADRIAEEYQPGKHGFAELVAVPWYDPDAFVHAAADATGAPAGALASDGHPAFGTDSSDDLTALRLALSVAEQDDLRALGADAAMALEQALTAWVPGERDLDIQARVAAALEARGADAPVLIVGGDDRVRRFRHPMAAGAPVHHLAMAVVVARRGGLHAAATRFASALPLSAELQALWEQVRRIEAATLAAGRPGHSYGDVLAALDHGYAAEGAPGGWAGHYQGGPIGYAQREFEIAPGQDGSRWPGVRIEPGHAVAWNPSLPGGAKAEDTYLVHADGLERVTTGPGWPTSEGTGSIPPRPLVLEVRS
jgi:Xaa-Pro dipeptidase